MILMFAILVIACARQYYNVLINMLTDWTFFNYKRDINYYCKTHDSYFPKTGSKI